MLDKIEDLSPNNNYFIALHFDNKKLRIYIFSSNISKSNQFNQVIDISNNKCFQINLKIGHNDNEKEYYKGFIGSLYLIKTKKLSIESKINYEDIIFIILELKHLYKYFPYFSKITNYNFDNILLYYNVDDEILLLKNRRYLQANIKDFECELYLNPKIIEIYDTLNDKNNQIG